MTKYPRNEAAKTGKLLRINILKQYESIMEEKITNPGLESCEAKAEGAFREIAHNVSDAFA